MRGGRGRWCVAVVLVGLLTACGGSSSSAAERTKLVNKLSSQTKALPPDLGQCVDQGAKALPISQLRDLANAGDNPSQSTRHTALQILTGCLSAGKGVSTFRSAIVREVSSTVPATVPASFKACLEARANTITSGQLSTVLSAFVTQGAATARASGERLGRSLARQCLDQPGVLGALKTMFLSPIRQFVKTSHYSAAFRNCVLHKAERISLAQLRKFALNPAGARAAGVAIGRDFAQACIASGARP